ncbi:MAG: PrsW family intramembrane metalloprotease [Chitinophagaceae bacterium]|nr:PrsW family intramembrane metalloprotease [Chitinophagaceae bacterium]
MGLLALAIAPGIAICLFIYFKDKHNREPVWLMLISFIMGVVSIAPALIIQLTLTKPVNQLMGEGIFYTAVFSYLIVALSEEGSKFLGLRLVPFRKKAFDDPFDGILYAVMVSMGFATLENIGYVFQHGFGTGILRMFLSVPAHATFGVLMGYHIGLAKFDPENRKRHMLLAIFWPVFFHGTFDFFLFLPKNDWNGLFLFGGALVSFIVAVKLSLKLIRRKQEISKNYFVNMDTINKEGHDIL